MRSKILLSIIVLLLLVLVGTWRLVSYAGTRNSLVADCNAVSTWWDTRVTLSNKAFDTLYDESLSRRERQEKALTLLDGLVTWEKTSKVPDFAGELVSAAITNDQQWQSQLRNTLGDEVPTPTGEEMFTAMQDEDAAFAKVADKCGWPLDDATTTARLNQTAYRDVIFGGIPGRAFASL